jgi:hypothetical protein
MSEPVRTVNNNVAKNLFRRFKGSRVQGFKGPKVQGFKGSKVQGFKGSIFNSQFSILN